MRLFWDFIDSWTDFGRMKAEVTAVDGRADRALECGESADVRLEGDSNWIPSEWPSGLFRTEPFGSGPWASELWPLTGENDVWGNGRPHVAQKEKQSNFRGEVGGLPAHHEQANGPTGAYGFLEGFTGGGPFMSGGPIMGGICRI
jgi:hypothetical protein